MAEQVHVPLEGEHSNQTGVLVPEVDFHTNRIIDRRVQKENTRALAEVEIRIFRFVKLNS